MASRGTRSRSRSTFIIRENEPVSRAIARAICTIEDVPIDELSPLYYTVETKASEALPAELRPGNITQFGYWGYQVNIIGQDLLEVWCPDRKKFN